MKLTSYSSIASLSSGDWDGHFSLATIKKTGDLAIGTFDQGNGELLAIDGEYYQLLSDGSVHLVENDWTSPYAVNVFFTPMFSLELNNVSQTEYLTALSAEIEKHGNQYLYALKVTGDFEQITSRTVSTIPKPYPTIKAINEIQRVREFKNLSGANIVGFYTPQYLKTISVDGFHQHFINQERNCGGHVLDFHAKHLKIDFAKVADINLIINDHPFTYHDGLQAEIQAVEKSK